MLNKLKLVIKALVLFLIGFVYSASDLDEKLVWEQLQTCYDPELPIDLWNLGLIYNIDINKQKKEIKILMTLTTPGCSMANNIANDVRNKLLKINGIFKVAVDITFDPEWTPEMMTSKGREKLGFKSKNNHKNNWE